MNKIIKMILLFFAVAFALNFIWENLQFPLYSGNNIGIDNYWLLMLYASFVDAFWILAVYLLIVIIDKDVDWKLNTVNITLFSIFLIGIAMAIERLGLALGRWVYSSYMPVIFGIGLSPLLQLVVTGLISLFIVRKIIS